MATFEQWFENIENSYGSFVNGTIKSELEKAFYAYKKDFGEDKLTKAIQVGWNQENPGTTPSDYSWSYKGPYEFTINLSDYLPGIPTAQNTYSVYHLEEVLNHELTHVLLYLRQGEHNEEDIHNLGFEGGRYSYQRADAVDWTDYANSSVVYGTYKFLQANPTVVKEDVTIHGAERQDILTFEQGTKKVTINNYHKKTKDLGIELIDSVIVIIDDKTALEADETMSFKVSISMALDYDITINTTKGSVTIAAGSTSGSVVYTWENDMEYVA